MGPKRKLQNEEREIEEEETINLIEAETQHRVKSRRIEEKMGDQNGKFVCETMRHLQREEVSATRKLFRGDFQFHSKAKLLREDNTLGLPQEAPRMLSNFFLQEQPILVRDKEIGDIEMPSVEHAYQLSKCLISCSSKDQKDKICKIFTSQSTLQDSAKAKTLGSKRMFTKFGIVLDQERWNKMSKGLMEGFVRQKVTRNLTIQRILAVLHKENMRLVHYSRSDRFWGALRRGTVDPNDSASAILEGRNELGNIFHCIMDELFSSK